MKSLKQHIITLLAGLTVAFSVIGQKYPVKQFTTREGLVQMQVLSVLEDSRGYIWAGTKGGLSKFDGEHFENFTTKNGMYAKEAYDLTEDSQGNIWYRITDRGYDCFDGKTFKHFMIQNGMNNGNLTEHKDAMWFIADNKIHYIKNDSIYHFKLNEKLPGQRYAYHMTKFPQLQDLYIFIDNELYRLNEKERKAELIRAFDHTIYFINQYGQAYIKENAETYTVIHSLKDGKFEKTAFISDKERIVYSPPLKNLLISEMDGTYLIEKGSFKVEKISNYFGGTNNFIHSGADPSRIYFATEKGLFVVYTNGFRYFEETEVPYAWSVAEDANNNMWFANYGFDLQSWDGKTIKSHHDISLRSWQKSKNTLKNNGLLFNSTNHWYFHALRDQNEKVWIPNLSGVQIIHKNQKDEYLTYRTDKEPDQLNFFYIAEDKIRNKILGCGNHELAVIENKPPYKKESVRDTSAIFTNPYFILCAMVDEKGDYWFGAGDVGRYNPENKTFQYYLLKDGDRTARGVGTLMQDSRGRIWAGTFGEGLYLFNEQKEVFERIFSSKLNGPSYYLGEYDTEHIITGDYNNLYIINTSKSDFQTNPEIMAFNHHNGFMGLEPGQAGFYKDSKNRIWVTSNTVLSYIETDKLKLIPGKQNIFLREINGHLLSLTNIEDFRLSSGVNDLNIRVEATGTDKSFNSEFSYKIDGFTKGWSDWITGGQIYINSLTPGWHTLEVRSKNSLGQTGSVAIQKFYVDIPFYKSPRFYQYAAGLGSLLMLGLISLFYRSHRQAKNLRNQLAYIKEQEKKVRMLQVQTNQAQLNPHFTFNVLGTLQNMILNQQSERANDNLVKLSVLIRNFMETSLKMNENEGSLIKMEISLEDEIDLLKKYIEFEQLQYENRFDYKLTIDPKIDPQIQQIPPLIIQPYVENAIKHGILLSKEKGLLSIKIKSCGEDCIGVNIQDNGVGIEVAREMQKTMIKNFKSRGMELIEKRIEILNEMDYKINVETHSEPWKGTTIKLTIDYKS